MSLLSFGAAVLTPKSSTGRPSPLSVRDVKQTIMDYSQHKKAAAAAAAADRLFADERSCTLIRVTTLCRYSVPFLSAN